MRTAFLLALLVALAGCAAEPPATEEPQGQPEPKATKEAEEPDAILAPEQGITELTRYIAVVGAPGCDGMRIQAEAPGSVEYCGNRAPAPAAVQASGSMVSYPAGSTLALDLWGTSDVPNPTTIKIRMHLNATLIVEDTWDYLASGGGGINVASHESHDRLQRTYDLPEAGEGKLTITFERTQGESFWVTSGGSYTSSLTIRAA